MLIYCSWGQTLCQTPDGWSRNSLFIWVSVVVCSFTHPSNHIMIKPNNSAITVWHATEFVRSDLRKNSWIKSDRLESLRQTSAQSNKQETQLRKSAQNSTRLRSEGKNNKKYLTRLKTASLLTQGSARLEIARTATLAKNPDRNFPRLMLTCYEVFH